MSNTRYRPSAATASVSHFSTITTPVADNNDDQPRFPSQPFSWSILQQLMRESTSDTSKTTRPLEHKGGIIPFEPSERLAMLHPISKVFPSSRRMDGCGKLTATRNHCQVLPMLHVTSLKVPLHFACADAETTDPISHRFHGKPTLVAVTWRGGGGRGR
jgi:hypothetical protein